MKTETKLHLQKVIWEYVNIDKLTELKEPTSARSLGFFLIFIFILFLIIYAQKICFKFQYHLKIIFKYFKN